MPARFAPATDDAVPIWFVHSQDWDAVRSRLPEAVARYAETALFEPKPGRQLVVRDGGGKPVSVLAGIEAPDARHLDLLAPGRLATLLPPGTYRFANAPHDTAIGALAWLLGLYRFTRYKGDASPQPALMAPNGVDAARIERIAAATALARDLVNTPANDLGPDALEQAALEVAHAYGAHPRVVRGEALLNENLPLLHAVGRAAAQAPRLVEFMWGEAGAPRVTLVGKGVTFDTGGLNIKPDASMLLMKKDMGGAATTLALAQMIMDGHLKVRLRVIVAIVENAISGNAFRPGDVLASRKGLTVEIGNTDAEGRLILADALALADEDSPELLIDFATLTGAARVALGPELPAFYTDDDALAQSIAEHGSRMADPVWRMPLWRPYDSLLDSNVADLNNISGGSFAGSITAALFLRRFVEHAKTWVHFDIFGWTPKARAGRPEGGETQAAWLLYDLLEKRYGRTPPAAPRAS